MTIARVEADCQAARQIRHCRHRKGKTAVEPGLAAVDFDAIGRLGTNGHPGRAPAADKEAIAGDHLTFDRREDPQAMRFCTGCRNQQQKAGK